ncbi:hypothetical protein [Parapedobacter sp. 10938]|uniref:hypothetical protein n=1 Tax=Parapedobacter flavus TaxID=3110225 RepID=UPI002DBD8936|nr:hypothetical protein [Parapedobacter sp. 10938]MEC3878819.1 hypothetical protein [Parapedobacter sp. 10938]
MKKYLTLVVGLIIIGGMSSCTKEYYDTVPSQTFIYEIGQNGWTWEDGVSHQVFHTKTLPELNDYYLLEGGVSVAISFDGESSYDILPTTFNGIAYSVNYTVGAITIFAEDPLAEAGIEIPLPDPAVVKVILSESDFIREF